ncbi:hypothetical protein Ahy_B04g069501 [Arachis hypogaea]|uniref:BED-type domain-containing protein n=1 Tax=Arachis hypogaea TaxID=3818 RepID=A0A444ZCU6_ARAHY|nr:hypothetical protein Ahy_B04g069501 [Arachis hypogaea]
MQLPHSVTPQSSVRRRLVGNTQSSPVSSTALSSVPAFLRLQSSHSVPAFLTRLPLSSNFRVASSPLTVAESDSVSSPSIFGRRGHRCFSVWPSSLLPAGLGPGLLGGWVLSSDSAGLAIRHGCSSPPLWLCPGNMNSETVSNLVTTGVGSEAAPVEFDEPSSKRLRPATSDVWKFFKKLGPDKDGVERAECKGCKKVFKAGGGLSPPARQPAIRRGGLGFWDRQNRRGGAGQPARGRASGGAGRGGAGLPA